MDKLLQIAEPTTQPDAVEIDHEKLKFFNSKLKIWDFAKISSSELQSLSFDEKSSLLKKYYIEMLAKYTEGKGKLFFVVVWQYSRLVFD